MRGYFAQVRGAGFDIGLSTGKLAKAMVDLLLQLPPEAAPSKEIVVQHLGLLGQMSKTRDMNAAWNNANRQVVREHPDRFCLDGKVLRWASAMDDRPRVKLSTADHRKLAAMAEKEGMTPDELLVSGDYYEPFAVNSRNFMETGGHRGMERGVQAAPRALRCGEREGVPSQARECFDLLLDLLARLDRGEEVVFLPPKAARGEVADLDPILPSYFAGLGQSRARVQARRAASPSQCERDNANASAPSPIVVRP